jgi:hypothetical protein
MEHLTQQDIEDYFSGSLSTEKEIKAGIHIDECRECFTRAGLIYKKYKALDNAFDSLSELPAQIEKLETARNKHLEQTDKNDIISIIEKIINNVSDRFKNKLTELLIQLRDPAFEMIPFSSLIGSLDKDLRKTLSEEMEIREIGGTYLPGNKIHFARANPHHIECRIESPASDLPTIFAHLPGSGIDIINFNKVEGTDFYSALIPENSANKHYLVHKTQAVMPPNHKKQ